VRSSTRLLVRDEWIGFAKSKVMLVLWIVLPAIAIIGYLLLPTELLAGGGAERPPMSATAFMSFLMSSVAGTVAALMVAVDIISEKNRKVYELYIIRPIRPEAIIWAKFIAVFTSVAVGCIASIGLGIAVDAIRGHPVSSAMLYDAGRSLVAMTSVIALSTTVGVFFGVVAKSIVVAVILILYGGQNLSILPMLPIYLGILPNHFWLVMLISGTIALLLLLCSGILFRRAQY